MGEFECPLIAPATDRPLCGNGGLGICSGPSRRPRSTPAAARRPSPRPRTDRARVPTPPMPR